ncbi:glycerophosphodiester phosphodiesterase family protein [Candidatus Izemoplasma sp. B36]|uniref:glycerophosphodiester phosphodiesterase family protein n=1 Tax=Candidatus Izemoplasma sp. B36 TaxID=3242468 RepID=UPI0035590F97
MKDLNWIKEMYIAHRGLHSKDQSIPENSIPAFKFAVKKNYGIEMDINVLKDGTVIVFHDYNLKRLVGKDINLGELNYNDIKDFKILNTNEKIPTLKEVLDLVDGKVPLLIELKPLGDNMLLCEKFYETIRTYKGKYGIHSFSPNIVRWFKKNHPDIIRGQITEYFRDNPNMKKISKYLMKSMFFNRFTKPDFVNYGIKDLPNKYCDKAYKKGLCIISYASRNQEEFDMVKKHYDNSVFEFFIPKK